MPSTITLTITAANLADIGNPSLQRTAEEALSQRGGAHLEVHRGPLKDQPGIVVTTLVVDVERAGQVTNGDAVWGDWDAKAGVIHLDEPDADGRPLVATLEGEEMLLGDYLVQRQVERLNEELRRVGPDGVVANLVEAEGAPEAVRISDGTRAVVVGYHSALMAVRGLASQGPSERLWETLGLCALALLLMLSPLAGCADEPGQVRPVSQEDVARLREEVALAHAALMLVEHPGEKDAVQYQIRWLENQLRACRRAASGHLEAAPGGCELEGTAAACAGPCMALKQAALVLTAAKQTGAPLRPYQESFDRARDDLASCHCHSLKD